MADLLLARAGGLEGFERYVVVKRIRADSEEDPAFVAMFLAEARLAAVLHHHNIVQVNDVGEVDGKPYFTMEYVHGHDLRHLLAHVCNRREHIPLQHVITIVAAVATALHHAHDQKGPDGKPLDIVHRDVTPANVLVGFDGNVKVVDFGLARAALRRSETQAGMLRGKAPYMAPEQCTGGRIDRRSDVFALGVVLYELATARRLFKGDNEFYTMAAIVNGAVPPPSASRADLPPALDEIVLRALSRDPGLRYQTAEQMFNALDELALRSALRTSSTALAAYMKAQFGEPPEPWLASAPERRDIGVDWDGAQPGLVVPPGDVGVRAATLQAASEPDLDQPTMVSAWEDEELGGVPSLATPPRKPDSVQIPSPGPAPEGTAARGAAAQPAGGRTRPKTVQIPVPKVGTTQVLANPLTIAVPKRATTVEPDDDAQLPKTLVVANPLAAAPVPDAGGAPQRTLVVAKTLAAAEQFSESTDVLAVPGWRALPPPVPGRCGRSWRAPTQRLHGHPVARTPRVRPAPRAPPVPSGRRCPRAGRPSPRARSPRARSPRARSPRARSPRARSPRARPRHRRHRRECGSCARGPGHRRGRRARGFCEWGDHRPAWSGHRVRVRCQPERIPQHVRHRRGQPERVREYDRGVVGPRRCGRGPAPAPGRDAGRRDGSSCRDRIGERALGAGGSGGIDGSGTGGSTGGGTGGRDVSGTGDGGGSGTGGSGTDGDAGVGGTDRGGRAVGPRDRSDGAQGRRRPVRLRR